MKSAEPRPPLSLLVRISHPAIGATLWVTLALGVGMLPEPLGAVAALLVGAIFLRVYQLTGATKSLRECARVRLRPLTRKRAWLVGVLLAASVYGIGYIFLAARLRGGGPGPKAEAAEATSLICSCLVVPIIEEVWFRGWMLRSLESQMGRLKAASLTAFVFAAIHFQLSGMPHRIISGMIAAGVLYETRSIWAAILVHAMNNTLAFGLMKIDIDDAFVLGASGRRLTIALLAVGLGGLAIAYATRGRRPQAAVAVVRS
jgi:membrane protease YdiL (CAAX protease family)